MDVVTMAMSKPKVVDLTAYKASETSATINDIVLVLMQDSVASGGTLKSMMLTDANLQLRRALSANRHILLGMCDTGGVKTTSPAVIMKNEDTAVQASASSLFYMQGTVIDLKCVLLYNYNENDAELTIYVQANGTPAA